MDISYKSLSIQLQYYLFREAFHYTFNIGEVPLSWDSTMTPLFERVAYYSFVSEVYLRD